MKKIFTNDMFFLASTVLSVLGMITLLIAEFIGGQEFMSYNLTLSAFPLCTLLLYISYKSHNKNVMKSLLGSLLMAMVISDVIYVTLNDVFALFFMTCDILLFFSHLLINSDRHSSPLRVRFSQCVIAVYCIIEIIWTVIHLINACSIYDYVFTFSSAVAYLSTASVIVCVESRLDAYRLDREAAGWTEEKGYPKDYVHEYEKNKK